MNPEDIFEFKMRDIFPGYNSASDKTKLKPGFLIRGSKNVYKKVNGNLASRPGLKRRGSVDATQAGVKSSHEFETNLGAVRTLRVAGGKLEVESDLVTTGTYVWYELKLTSTLESLAGTYTRFVFDSWWDPDDKSSRLVMVRGDSRILYWSGGMVLIDSAPTETTLKKQGTTTWAQEGFALTIAGEKKVMLSDGREITYTGGEGTTTLTGVTYSSGDSLTVTSGMVAIQSVFSTAGGATKMFPSTYTPDFIKVFGNQSFVGSYSSRLIYQSADSTPSGEPLGFLNYENTSDRVAGDPDVITLDNLAKGIGEKNGQLVIFAGNDEMYLITPNTNVTFAYTINAAADRAFVYNKVEKKVLTGLSSALGHEFIGNFGDYLVWVDQKHQLRALGAFTNEVTIKPITLSLPVQTELFEDDFTGGHLKTIEDTIYITAPNNGRDWMFTSRETVNNDGSVSSEKFWHAPQVRSISRFALIDGTVYGYSNVNPQIYQVWDTGQWFDDVPSGEEMPYSVVMTFSYENNNRPQGLNYFDKAYFEGFMMQGVDLKALVLFDYQGSKGTRELEVSKEGNLASFYTGINPSSLGDLAPGLAPLGDGIIEESNFEETVPKFRAICNILQAKDCFDYTIQVYSLESDARWELSRFGLNVKISKNNPTFLRK